MSFPRKRESSDTSSLWTPAFAGATNLNRRVTKALTAIYETGARQFGLVFVLLFEGLKLNFDMLGREQIRPKPLVGRWEPVEKLMQEELSIGFVKRDFSFDQSKPAVGADPVESLVKI